MESASKMDDVIERRINFLLDCAKQERKRDQAITFVMRVISNYATIGKDGGSSEIKKYNRRVSKSSLDLFSKAEFRYFSQMTINEHPKPLKSTWEWLTTNSECLNKEDVWEEFKNFSMITITKKEDALISSLGLRSVGDINNRYKDNNICVIELERAPVTLINDLSKQKISFADIKYKIIC